MIPNVLYWLLSPLAPGHRCAENRIQNMFNGPVNLQANGQPVRNPEPVVHLSETKSSTRETGTRKKVAPMYDRNWITIPAFHACEKDFKSSYISKMVTKMVRHHDQDERDHDGAVHWNTMYPVLLRKFGDQIGRRCTDKDWIGHIHFGSNKTRFEYCLNSRK